MSPPVGKNRRVGSALQKEQVYREQHDWFSCHCSLLVSCAESQHKRKVRDKPHVIASKTKQIMQLQYYKAKIFNICFTPKPRSVPLFQHACKNLSFGSIHNIIFSCFWCPLKICGGQQDCVFLWRIFHYTCMCWSSSPSCWSSCHRCTENAKAPCRSPEARSIVRLNRNHSTLAWTFLGCGSLRRTSELDAVPFLYGRIRC